MSLHSDFRLHKMAYKKKTFKALIETERRVQIQLKLHV